MQIIRGNESDKEYFDLQTTGSAGLAFQVGTASATMYITFAKLDAVSVTEGFLGVTIESWPEWDLNLCPRNSN